MAPGETQGEHSTHQSHPTNLRETISEQRECFVNHLLKNNTGFSCAAPDCTPRPDQVHLWGYLSAIILGLISSSLFQAMLSGKRSSSSNTLSNCLSQPFIRHQKTTA